MKKILCFVSTALFFSLALSAASPKIGGSPLKSFKIIYSATAEPEVAVEAATTLQKCIQTATGVTLSIAKDTCAAVSREILVGETNRPQSMSAYSSKFGPFEYSAVMNKGKLVLAAGGCWALDKAGALAVENIRNGKLNSSFKTSGTVEGEYLFPREEGVNLRILDDNVWDYSKDESPEIWKEAGQECTDAVRTPQFVQIVRAYMPDVMGFQEFSNHMRAIFNPSVDKLGYKEAIDVTTLSTRKNDTPVYYNAEKVELLDAQYILYTPKKWSNHNSKSLTWAVFKHKETGRIFALLSTHLWWKGEKVVAGSNLARASQVRLAMAEVEGIKAKYNCPVFVVGDMNCHENSIAMKQFIDDGYIPCYKAATNITSSIRGHHKCGPKEVGNRTNLYKPRAEAIDHCFIYNGGKTEIRNFKVETSAFSILLTDHCPNIIDAVLK